MRVEAVFENGVLRPLNPLPGVPEHSRVSLRLEVLPEGPNGIADCIGILPDDDAAELRDIIQREFERVDFHEWE